MSFGFEENKKSLKSEFKGLDGKELAALRKQGYTLDDFAWVPHVITAGVIATRDIRAETSDIVSSIGSASLKIVLSDASNASKIGFEAVDKNPPDIVYGTPIDVNRHLNAICLPLNPVHASPSADTFEPIVIEGTWNYDPSEGALLPAGQHTLTVSFHPHDKETYVTTVEKSVQIRVLKRSPRIEWNFPDPESIFFGTELSDIQLNAICTSDIDGDYEFKPGYGTVLEGGVHTLSVTFTPLDSANFSIVEQVVTIHVHPAPVTLIAEDLFTTHLSVPFWMQAYDKNFV
eukprot:gene18040-18277_t